RRQDDQAPARHSVVDDQGRAPPPRDHQGVAQAAHRRRVRHHRAGGQQAAEEPSGDEPDDEADVEAGQKGPGPARHPGPAAALAEDTMLDHVSLGVTDMERSKVFYDKVLAPLGHARVHDADFGSGYGPSPDQALFWIGYPLARDKKAVPSPGTHVAFTAETRQEVDAFYAAAMAAGGRDNGKPGLRPEYHATYYGAFVFDPDGHAIEAVCHKAE